MTNEQITIINDTIEKYIAHYKLNVQKANKDDLKQDIILWLLEHSDTVDVDRLYNEDVLTYYVWQMVKMQLSSTKSRYYYMYTKYNYRNDNPLPKDKEPSDNEDKQYREI